MVKFFEVISPRPGITVEEFHDHWRHPHASMVRRFASIRRYVQNHRIDSPLVGPNPKGYEGVVEARFESLEALMGLTSSDPFVLEEVYPDEERFIDRPEAMIVIVEEEVLAAGPADGATKRPASELGRYDLDWDPDRAVAVKVVQVVVRDGELGWAGDDDAELGYRVGALRHVRNHVTGEPAPCVGIRELWWPTKRAFERGVTADPDAWDTLSHRGAESFTLLCQAELVF